MIDLRPLSYFLVACEHENLGAAARTLGIAPSTLSASLKTLEADFGVPLFRKQGAGLSPRRMAYWLYLAAVPLLLLERFARHRVRAPSGAPVVRLRVDIKLSLAFGRFRQTLGAALAQTAIEEPLVLVDPHWPLDLGGAFARDATDALGFDSLATIAIGSVPRSADPAANETALFNDPWMLVRRQVGQGEDPVTMPASQSLMVPAFPMTLIEQVEDWAQKQGRPVQLLDTEPRNWPRLLQEYSGAALLLPTSAIGTRLGVSRIEAQALDPPLTSTIVAQGDNHPVADRFLARLRTALDGGGTTPAFEPVLSGRRVYYFNLAYSLGRVSAAARAANVAQPALSQQLQKLEESLGTSLFDRRSFGLVRTQASSQFALATELLGRRLREVELNGRIEALAEGGRLALGVLPSVGHHSNLTGCIADALEAVRELHPAMRLTIKEGPNDQLHRWVQRGRIGLAIVETVPSQMPRLSLNAAESLGVVADPRHRLLPPGPARLADICRVPLALPSVSFGLRQIVDAAARDAGIELDIRHEIDALAMLIATLRRMAVATLLPTSAVADECARGELVIHPIIDPAIARRLYVTFSGERPLMPVERDLVKALQTTLPQNAG